MVKKKLLSVVLVASTVCSMLLTGCGNDAGNTESGSTDTNTSTVAQTEEVVADDVEKPEKITIMVSGDFQATQANGQEEWIARWEELTGIELEIIQPDHSSYYDVLGQTLASGPENWPDIIYVGNSYYSGYAAEGVLWDMTDAWNNSELKKNPNTDASALEGNMIDGHLYGLPLASGGGCMTYIRKQWLDNCGLDVPTNYEEYLEMLDAFTNGDPDGDGINGNTVAVSAAGFVNGNAPYVNYLPEFYQDAYPSFYQGEDGTWKDGFTEDSMKAAIERLQDGVEGVHWSRKAETVCGNTYQEGEFHMLESLSQPGVQYTTINMGDNNICPMTERLMPESEYTKESMEIFNTNKKKVLIIPTTEAMSQYNGDLTTLKNSIIADCIVQGLSVEDGYKRFEQEGGAEMSQTILDSLNN